jgi:DNA (cytosine-5)-methyltransferase 1
MLTAISLFTGIGGLDYGFHAAGFRTAVAVELDAICCETIRLNRDWPILEGDLNTFTSRKIMQVAGLKKGEADILIGGPPCQPFSKSSYWAEGDSRRLDDPRADTLTAFLRVLRDVQPRAFLLENVKGLAYQGKDTGLNYLLDGVLAINKATGANYQVSWQVLNAADYGVPQLRERVFLVASRDGRDFGFPEPTHGAGRAEPHRTAWDAIGDLASETTPPELAMRGKWAKLLASIPEGENYLWHTPRGGGQPLFGWRTRYWNFLLKLAKSRPSWTLQASPGPSTGPFHWDNRLLSPKEMLRLQTFPDDIVYDTSHRHIQRLVGNAVPSLLAETIATAIRKQFFDDPENAELVTLLQPRRNQTPPPKRVESVHSSFRHLIGQHPDHAGEGQGPRALRRTM